MNSPEPDTHFLQELRARFNSGERLSYVFFWHGDPSKRGLTASCFSQWYEAFFVIDGQRYPTTEHYMMAEKAALFGDRATREQVLQAWHPGVAKSLGRQVHAFDEAIWCEHRFSIVVRANQAKFTQNLEMGGFLKQTGAALAPTKA